MGFNNGRLCEWASPAEEGATSRNRRREYRSQQGFVRPRVRLPSPGSKTFGPVADYFALNISSPNTPGLRNLHARDDFEALVITVLAARDRVSPRRPVLVKISPDLDAETPRQRIIDCTRAANRRLNRIQHHDWASLDPDVISRKRKRRSVGSPPIFSRSTRLVAICYLRCRDALPIVGVRRGGGRERRARQNRGGRESRPNLYRLDLSWTRLGPSYT